MLRQISGGELIFTCRNVRHTWVRFVNQRLKMHQQSVFILNTSFECSQCFNNLYISFLFHTSNDAKTFAFRKDLACCLILKSIWSAILRKLFFFDFFLRFFSYYSTLWFSTYCIIQTYFIFSFALTMFKSNFLSKAHK